MGEQRIHQQWIADLESGSLFRRLAALQQLGQRRVIPAVPHLRRHIDDPDWLIRRAARGALQRIGTPEALAALHGEQTPGGASVPDWLAQNGLNSTDDVPGWLLEDVQPPTRPNTLPEWRYTPEPFVVAEPKPGPAPPPEQPPPLWTVPAPAGSHVSDPTALKFAVQHPPEMSPGSWARLVAYLYRAHAAVTITRDARRIFDESRSRPFVPGMSTIEQPARHQQPTDLLVQATPVLPGFTFSPVSVRAYVDADWQRFDFQMQAGSSLAVNRVVRGYMLFTVAGIIVGELPLSVFVGATMRDQQPKIQHTPLLHRIYPSYDPADEHIAARIAHVSQVLNLENVLTTDRLRQRGQWTDSLAGRISSAERVLLFWSASAARSDLVQREYTLAVRRQRLLRPVYWQQPGPAVPSLLARTHFAYWPDLASK